MELLENLQTLWRTGKERCGFITLDGSIIELDNVHEDPYNGFEINHEEVERYQGQIAATWHTHPETSANLSTPDLFCFLMYPDWYHYIVSQQEVRCYYVRNKTVFLVDDEEENSPTWSTQGALP